MSIFAPAEFLSSVAIAVEDDPDLEHGTHVRVLPSAKLGLPLAPLALWRVSAEPAEPEVVWRDRSGRLVTHPDLDAAGGTLYGFLRVPPAAEPQDQVLDVAVDVGGSFDGVAALVDAANGAEREYCRRSERPYLLAAPRVNRLRLQGRGVPELGVWRVRPSLAIEQMQNTRPHALLSLPIDGSRAWYAGGLGVAQAMDAVRGGAPRRLTPADRPDGPFDTLTRLHEEQRVQPHAADIIHMLEQVLGDPNTRPAAQRLSHDAVPQGRSERHWLDLHGVNHLLTQAMDPGLARFIGLAQHIHDLPGRGEPVAWVAMSLFAVTRYLGIALVPSPHDVLGDQPPMLARLVERYVRHVEDASGRAGELDAVIGRIRQGRNVAVRPVLCACGAVPPPDRPTLAAPEQPPDRARWIGRANEPSNAFRQDFIWRYTPLGGLVALGRREGGAWRTRHREAPLAPGSDSPPRALPMLMGRTGVWPQSTAGLLSDQPIPADPADPAPPAVRYRCAFADLFGRYGPPVEFDVAVPPRPAPPAPRLQTEVVLDGPSSSNFGEVSPGYVNVRVPIPPVADLPAGSLAPARLRLTFDGAPLPEIALQPAVIADLAAERNLPVVERPIALRPLSVADHWTSNVTAAFIGPFGAESPPGQVALRYNDRRHLPVVPCGLGLFWTSRPGPAPEVELRLSWRAPKKNARYRIYIADARSLGLTPGSRAHQAVEAGKRARDGVLGSRDRFRLLGDVAESGERALLDERLPRSLSGLQVLRIVPLTTEGREAPFDDCPVVPVAVPSERRAPMPSVSVVVDHLSGRPKVRIGAGFDWEWLRAAEPGLFTTPPDPAARAPEFRLRRTFGTVNDPLYAREVRRGPLTVVRAANGEWQATAEFEIADPLPSFVRAVWWCEVRPGAERRVRAGYAEPPPEGGVFPTNPLHADDAPFEFSVPAAPVMTLHAPPVAAPEVSNQAVRETGGGRGLRFELAAPPAAHVRAEKFRLRVWEQWGEHALQLAGDDLVLDGKPLVWEGPLHALQDAPLPASLVVAYVDPLDRVGATRRIAL